MSKGANTRLFALAIALIFAAALVFLYSQVAFAQGCGPSQHPSGKDRCDEPASNPGQGKAGARRASRFAGLVCIGLSCDLVGF